MGNRGYNQASSNKQPQRQDSQSPPQQIPQIRQTSPMYNKK